MVYFDNAATTPVPKAVADAMYEVLTAHFGNPSSQYPIGVEMKKAVEGWRTVIAGALGCPAERLYFTSCGTESDNWAIQAALWQNRHKGRHIITTAVEHSAVLEPCKLLAQQGYEVTYLKPGRDGNVTAEQVAGVNDTFPLTFIFLQFAFGCTAGFSVITANCVGSRDARGVRRSFAAQIELSLVISAFLTVLSILLLPQMLALINVTPAHGEVYTAAQN